MSLYIYAQKLMQEINKNLYPNFTGYALRTIRLMGSDDKNACNDLIKVNNCICYEIETLQSQTKRHLRKSKSDPIIGAKLSLIDDYFALSDNIIGFIREQIK